MTSAISPESSDPMGVPLICWTVCPSNWKYVVRQKFMSSIILGVSIFVYLVMSGELWSNVVIDSLTNSRPTDMKRAATSNEPQLCILHRYIENGTGKVMHDIINKESYGTQFEAIQHCFRIIGFTKEVSDDFFYIVDRITMALL